MQNSVIALVMSGVMLYCSGCASIVSKSQWPVTINSNPSGATVTIKDGRGTELQKGVTPMTVTLSSKSGYFSSATYHFDFEKEGYYPANSSTSASLSGWYWGNILFGGLIGMLIVDPATGAMWKLDENPVYGNLSPNPNSTAMTVKPEVAPNQLTPLPLAPDVDIPAKLLKLKELKNAGALTDEEYASKRKALVEKL